MPENENAENTQPSTPKARSLPALTPHDILKVYSSGGIEALKTKHVTRSNLDKSIGIMRVLSQPVDNVAELKAFYEALPTKGGRGADAVPGLNKSLLLNKQGQLIISGVCKYFNLNPLSRVNVSYEERDNVRRLVVTAPIS